MAILLLTILLIEGFITISVEVLTIRQLTPFFGSSVLITSIIIGVFLLFLAIGYWRGGRHQQNYLTRLRFNFSCSLMWIGFGLSFTFINIYYHLTVNLLGIPSLLSLFLFLLLALAPIVYWLGQTVPIATNLFNQKQNISRISGSALFLSTIGSFLGAILTSLLLFQYVGVAWTVVVNCVLLYLLIIYLGAVGGSSLLLQLLLSAFLILIIFFNVQLERHYFTKTNNYANYQVIEQMNFDKIFVVNHSASSRLNAQKKGFEYIEFIKKILFEALSFKHHNILVIGAGGFTLTAEKSHNNHVTYIDIDPEIKQIAESTFLKEPIKGQFKGVDARAVFKQHQEKWDVIVSDAYSNQTSIPPMLLTKEYFLALKQHLTPGGYMIANMIVDPLFRDKYSQTVDNTIRAVFPFCRSIPLTYNDKMANVIYICPNQQISTQSIYTDDLTTSTTDFFNLQNSQ